MRKYVLIFFLLLVIGCSPKRPMDQIDKKAVKVPEIKKKNQIRLFFNPDNMPAYYDVKNRDFYKNLLIIFPLGYESMARDIKSVIEDTQGTSVNLIKDNRVKKLDLISNNIMLLGSINNNEVLKQLYTYLPAYTDGLGLKVQEDYYEDKNLGTSYFYPNLYNLNKSMILILDNTANSTDYSTKFEKSDFYIYNGKEKKIAQNFQINWKLDI